MPQKHLLGHIFLHRKGDRGGFFYDFFSKIDFSAVRFFNALSLKILAFLQFLTL